MPWIFLNPSFTFDKTSFLGYFKYKGKSTLIEAIINFLQTFRLVESSTPKSSITKTWVSLVLSLFNVILTYFDTLINCSIILISLKNKSSSILHVLNKKYIKMLKKKFKKVTKAFMIFLHHQSWELFRLVNCMGLDIIKTTLWSKYILLSKFVKKFFLKYLFTFHY